MTQNIAPRRASVTPTGSGPRWAVTRARRGAMRPDFCAACTESAPQEIDMRYHASSPQCPAHPGLAPAARLAVRQLRKLRRYPVGRPIYGDHDGDYRVARPAPSRAQLPGESRALRIFDAHQHPSTYKSTHSQPAYGGSDDINQVRSRSFAGCRAHVGRRHRDCASALGDSTGAGMGQGCRVWSRR